MRSLQVTHIFIELFPIFKIKIREWLTISIDLTCLSLLSQLSSLFHYCRNWFALEQQKKINNIKVNYSRKKKNTGQYLEL